MRGETSEVEVSECWGEGGGGGTGSSASSEAKNVSTNRVGRKWSQMRTKSEYVT